MYKKFLLPVFIFLSLILIGCAPKTPLQKLADDKVYDDLTRAFWANEADKKTPLWNDALTYCRAHKEKPNCPMVIEVRLWTNHNTAFVPLEAGHKIWEPY